MAKYKLTDFIKESHSSNDQWLDAFQDALGFKTYMSPDYLISQYGDMKPEDAARKFTDDATKSAMAKDKEKFSRETGLEEDTVEEGEFKFRPTETDAPGMQARPDGYLKEKDKDKLAEKNLDVDPKELKIGIKIEKEHTNDAVKAEEIALDHLKEDPKYYSKLVKAGLEETLDYQHLMKVRAGIIK